MTKLLGHWKISKEFNPADYLGFLYFIENKITNQGYVGKKQFLIGKAKKKSPWLEYIGSSKHLKADIGKLGKENFTFEMIDVYKTKGGLYYSEVYCQVVLNCLIDYININDKEIPRFYNRQIAAVKFIPKEAPTEKTIKFIQKIRKKYNGENNREKSTM